MKSLSLGPQHLVYIPASSIAGSLITCYKPYDTAQMSCVDACLVSYS